MLWTMTSCVSAAMPFAAMPSRSFTIELFHALPGAAHADGLAQLFGFGAGEVADDHGHAQELLLKERNAERALQHRLERGTG